MIRCLKRPCVILSTPPPPPKKNKTRYNRVVQRAQKYWLCLSWEEEPALLRLEKERVVNDRRTTASEHEHAPTHTNSVYKRGDPTNYGLLPQLPGATTQPPPRARPPARLPSATLLVTSRTSSFNRHSSAASFCSRASW